MDKKTVEKISKALGDPYRLKIIEAIKEEPNSWMACSALVSMFNLSQSTISHHTKQLVDADLLVAEKEGRCTRYKLNCSVFGSYISFLSGYEKVAPNP
ncbi:ArsR family transcriptional regulator [Filimonas lacunae]|uniref:ArsR family transcriptional regulator n=1 Tax=Filimonas lacunae TaxID=477680 RepID=A0A173MA03_9BACT|nr:metalloregulator ArsR/SmtB family transcription factor [Filimonas lacunae]BAV04349.1 transcriptional regulator, ArsR family [Filimonas lacunae]SIT31098.1 ArsR family transcriptional regulator [Filimonas lacunae]